MPDILTEFLDETQSKGLQLYPAQEEADGNANGVGKVAGCEFFAPPYAIQKYALGLYLPNQSVGLSTGDATVNHNAPILCCTAEILEQIALREGENSNIGAVAMDAWRQ